MESNIHNHHEIIKCSCGAIIAQCRCMAPNKTIRTIDNGCENCKGNPPTLKVKATETVKALPVFGRS